MSPRTSNTCARGAACLMAAYFDAFGSVTTAQVPETVDIQGGAQPDNSHAYNYVVTNHASSPVVAVDLPHFRGDVFRVPEDWTFEATERFTSLNTGPGRFLAKVSNDRAAIAKRGQATFSVRISHLGAAQGRGEAVVLLKDGRRLTIPVECAVQESLIGRYRSLVGMGTAFVLFVLFGLWRSRRKPATTPRTP